MFGYALSLAQAGDQHDAAKVLKGFGVPAFLKLLKMMWVAPAERFTP